MSEMRVVIFVNGVSDDPRYVQELLCGDEWIIAVNGGTRHALRAGVLPHLIIGDLDSLDAVDQTRIRQSGVTLLPFPARKDETDLELALRYALEKDAAEITLVTALGGRLDHSLANIFLLALPELHNKHVRIVEGRQRAFLIRDAAQITGTPGDLVSLLPLSRETTGIVTDGLEWQLRGDTLPFGSTRGVSNVMLGNQASVRIQTGMLLCVVTKTLP